MSRLDSRLVRRSELDGWGIENLADVLLTAPASGSVLYYNGTDWIDALLDRLVSGTTQAVLTAGTLRVTRLSSNWAGMDVNGPDGGFFSVYEDENYLSSWGTFVSGGYTEMYSMPGYDTHFIVGGVADNFKFYTDATLALQIDQYLSTFSRSIKVTPVAGDPTATDGQIWYDLTAGKFRAYQAGAAVDLIGGGGGGSGLTQPQVLARSLGA